MNGRTECEKCRMFLTDCICECPKCGRYFRYCTCRTKEQQQQEKREKQKLFAINNFQVGTVVCHTYSGTGRVVNVDPVRQSIDVAWTNKRYTDGQIWIDRFPFQSCEEELKILIPVSQTTFGSEFEKGAIVEYINARHSTDKSMYNYSTNSFFGEIIEVGSATKEITVKWENGEISEVRFNEEPFIKVVCRTDNAFFDTDLKDDYVIDFSGNGPYAYIVEISEDRRTMKIQWEAFNGYPEDEPIVELSYLEFYANNKGEYHSLTTQEKRIDQLMYEDQLLEASIINEMNNDDDYDDGDY